MFLRALFSTSFTHTTQHLTYKCKAYNLVLFLHHLGSPSANYITPIITPLQGYGIGSGVSLFMTVNICETIAWKVISFQTIQTPYGEDLSSWIL